MPIWLNVENMNLSRLVCIATILLLILKWVANIYLIYCTNSFLKRCYKSKLAMCIMIQIDVRTWKQYIFFICNKCVIIMRGCVTSYGIINHMLVVGNGIYLLPAISDSSSEQPFHISIVIPLWSWNRWPHTLFKFYKN